MSNSTDKIPWFEPSLDADDAEAVKQQVLKGFVNEGPANREFEANLVKFFGVPHACTTPSCTMALALSLMALGIKHGDTVLVPDITFIGTAGAVRLAGAEPILIDVSPDDFNMSPADAVRRLKPSTKAIIVVHLNGRSADMGAFQKICKEKGLKLVEDCAESLASKNAAGYLGTQSDAGCFSFAPTKVITSGQGGFILTRSQETRDNIVRLKDHGRLSRSSDVHPVTGFNFKVTDLQAALAMSQWKKLEKRIARAHEVDARYLAGLKDCSELNFPERPKHGGYLMWPDFKMERRNELVKHLLDRGIVPRPFWPALHMQPAYASNEPFPGATDATKHACWLPCSPAITNEQIDRVIETIRAFFKK
jgi:perosamine synthetase